MHHSLQFVNWAIPKEPTAQGKHTTKGLLPLFLQAGVKTIDIDRKMHKVSVTGYVEPKKVLKKVKATGKRAEMWPYVPYNLVAEPYSAQTYDKKAPAGFVRKDSNNLVAVNPPPDEKYTAVFSEENPNACSVM
eukprot:TRINITY_DN1802_c0_g1_i2.p2 TRINITY_DN1802_c0_g1~~TRINITY_DN1802_c0_g1_i2.p2  ORF type:complete len:133 (-),score=22.87 TRINITY_DN1802_c0_g1_i2:251-649(-)